MSKISKSDSRKRLEVEEVIIQELIKSNSHLNFLKSPLKFENIALNVDLYSEDLKQFYEIYSGIEDLKPGQKRKLLTDVLKLNLIEKLLDKNIEKYLVLIDEKIKQKLLGKSWSRLVFEKFDIKIQVINLKKINEKLYDEVMEDKSRQKME